MIADELKYLYQGDMTVIEYYNRFMELAKYYMVGNVDASALILKFMSRLWQSIAKHMFNTLMDYYASAQLAEANIESRNVECA